VAATLGLHQLQAVFGQIKEQQGARRFLRRACAPAGRSGSCSAAPQPAQAVAAHDHAASGQAGDRLSDRQWTWSTNSTSNPSTGPTATTGTATRLRPPKTLLGVLLYAYAVGVRSSRQIQRRCVEDVAFRVLAANQMPDHVTIARFRVRHEQALAGFLVESLKLCAVAGMVRLGTVALDGTKVAANAAERANRTHGKLEEEVAEILRQAAEADQREDREHGAARGDELPEGLASKAGRLQRLRVAKAQLEAEAAERQRRYEQRVAELAAAARAKGKQPKARVKPRRRDEAPDPKRVANVTDPDSRLVRTRKGSVQATTPRRSPPASR
jgi:hypothetical protein